MEAFENTYSNMRKGWLLRTFIFLCLLIFAYWALVSVTPLLPTLELEENLRDASLLLENESEFWMPFGHMPTMDNHSDAIMLNIIGVLDPKEPIRSAMRMSVSYYPNKANNPIQNFKDFTEGKKMATWSYARYWHGGIVFLRPMLSIITLGEVRKILFFCLMILFSIAIILLTRRTNWVIALGFAVSMTFGGFPLLAFCITYAGVFIIALVVMCSILHLNIRDEESLVKLFLLSGSLTTFIGFGGMSAPVITFMFPVLSILLPDLEMKSFRWDWHYVRRLFLFGVVWSAGYLLTWGSKWVLSDIILGEGLIVNEAINNILSHTGNAHNMSLFDRLLAIVKNIYTMCPFSMWSGGGEGKAHTIYAIIRSLPDMEGSLLTRFGIILNEVSHLLPASLLLGFVVTALFIIVYLIIIFYLAIDSKKRRIIGALGYFSLGFLFLVPYFWYFVTASHAEMHYWFTFRNQISSLWLFLVFPHIMKKAGDI